MYVACAYIGAGAVQREYISEQSQFLVAEPASWGRATIEDGCGLKRNNTQNEFLHLRQQCPLHHAEKGLATAHSAQHRAITPRQIASALRGAVVFVDLLGHVHVLRRDVVPARTLRQARAPARGGALGLLDAQQDRVSGSEKHTHGGCKRLGRGGDDLVGLQSLNELGKVPSSGAKRGQIHGLSEKLGVGAAEGDGAL